MPFAAADVRQATAFIWQTMFGIDIEHMDAQTDDFASRALLTSCVEINGAAHAAVKIQCPETLARKMAGLMFDTPPQEVADGEVRDALGELANLLGGNLKSFLSEGHEPGLPSDVDGDGRELSATFDLSAHQLAFQCDSEPFHVAIMTVANGAR